MLIRCCWRPPRSRRSTRSSWPKCGRLGFTSPQVRQPHSGSPTLCSRVTEQHHGGRADRVAVLRGRFARVLSVLCRPAGGGSSPERAPGRWAATGCVRGPDAARPGRRAAYTPYHRTTSPCPRAALRFALDSPRPVGWLGGCQDAGSWWLRRSGGFGRWAAGPLRGTTRSRPRTCRCVVLAQDIRRPRAQGKHGRAFCFDDLGPSTKGFREQYKQAINTELVVTEEEVSRLLVESGRVFTQNNALVVAVQDSQGAYARPAVGGKPPD